MLTLTAPVLLIYEIGPLEGNPVVCPDFHWGEIKLKSVGGGMSEIAEFL